MLIYKHHLVMTNLDIPGDQGKYLKCLPSPTLLPSSCSFPGGSYSKLSNRATFTVWSHTFILFWLTKTSVSVKMYQLSLVVLFYFICIFFLEMSPYWSSIQYSFPSVYNEGLHCYKSGLFNLIGSKPSYHVKFAVLKRGPLPYLSCI